MLMKIVTSVLLALLVVALGGAAIFYLKTYQPMAAEYKIMKSGMAELDKAKTELKKYKEKENRESAWLNPAIDVLSAGLADQIQGGKAEVLTAGGKVIVNIAEEALYMPESYTFSKESRQLLLKLESLFRSSELKGKEIVIGNTTESVPGRGKGRKKIPAKDARTLAADRSSALVKHLEKNGVDQNALIASAYSAKQPEIGFKLKSRKTVIIIQSPLVGPAVVSQQAAAAAQLNTPAATKPSATAPAAAQTQPKMIPIQPARPTAP